MDIRKWFKAKDNDKPATAKTAPNQGGEVAKRSSGPPLKKATHPVQDPEPVPKPKAARTSRSKKRVVEDSDGDDEEEEKEWENDEDEMVDENDVAVDLDDEDEDETSGAKSGKRKRKGGQPAKQKVSSQGRGRGKPASVKAGSVLPPSNDAAIGATQETERKPAGRGRGGWGRGAFMAEKDPPPHKGEKEVPKGAEDALAGITFVISGTLDSLEREEAEDLIKSHGGRITGSVSKKTSFLLADEDIGGSKSKKAKELGVPVLSEDGLFEMIRATSSKAAPVPPASHKPPPTKAPSAKENKKEVPPSKQSAAKKLPSAPQPSKGASGIENEAWPQKYAPKSSDEIVANQGIVKQLQDWLTSWQKNSHAEAMAGKKAKRGASSGTFKKAVLISGNPGIGKTTTARVVAQELGFQLLEVNASDTRGKSDSKLTNGMAGKTANIIKEMVSNASITLPGDPVRPSVLIMDEVDGMSGGDRGGVADLIASIRVTRVPIICICNDRYARQLQSLGPYCLLLNYRKPTKQQMAKRLRQVASKEHVDIADNVLEELSERVGGDMRMALNQLQYMSVRSRHLSYGDVRKRLQASQKDEDLRPMAAVDKLLGFASERLRLDERLDAALSDFDLVPLMVQENYLNYKPKLGGSDSDGSLALERSVRAADCISYGDIVNVAIRRFQHWQLLPFSGVMACVYPGALIHGQRQVFNQGEMNFNRFPGWLGKNSTAGKNRRLLDDLSSHMLASRLAEPTRLDVRLDYVPVLADRLTTPLKTLPKEEGVSTVLRLMEEYSLTLEDNETILSLLKFKGSRDYLEGVPAAVKGQLTRDFKKSSHRVKSSDLLPDMSGLKGGGKRKLKARLAQHMEDDSAHVDSLDVPVAMDDAVKEEEEEEEEEEDAAPVLSVSKSSARGRGRGRGRLSAHGAASVGFDSGSSAAASSDGGGQGRGKGRGKGASKGRAGR